MSRKINIGKRDQVENTFEVSRGDEGEVAAVGMVVYEDLEEGWSGRCPKIGAAYPDDTSLRLKKISKRRMDAGVVQVTLHYELPRIGAFGFGGEETEYSVDYSCSEQPLLSHKLFKNLDDDEKDALLAVAGGSSPTDTFGDEGKVIKDEIKSSNGKKALEKLRMGIISFLCPAGTFSVTSTKGSVSLSGVGQKGSPPAGAPAVPSGCDWMKDGISGRRTGNANWRVTETWRLSGSNGLDADLY